MFGLGAGLILNSYRSPSEFSYSLIGFFFGIGILVVPFLFGWIGAGDVKYLGAIGAMLGVKLLPRVLFYASLVSGLMAVTLVLAGHCRISFSKRVWTECKIAALTCGRVLPDNVSVRVSQGGHSLPWGVALTVGTLLAYFVDHEGYWAGF